MNNIFSVKVDLVAVAKDALAVDDGTGTMVDMMVPGWVGGAFGTNNNKEWNGNMAEWSVNEYANEWAYCEPLCRPGIDAEAASKGFNSTFETNYLTIMCWAQTHDVDLYIANITFEDADGKVITLD